MQPGQWKLLVTSNTEVLEDCVGGGQGHMIPYAEGMKWDSKNKKAWYIGSDDPINCPSGSNFARVISYDEATNKWSIMPKPSWISANNHLHQYDASPIDVENRILYFAHAAGGANHKYNLDTGAWTTFPSLGSYGCCEAMEYFPDMKALIHIRQGEVWRFNDGGSSWTKITDGLTTSYHSIAEYNPVHKTMVFGGGSPTSDTFYLLNSSGQVTALGNPPVNLNVPVVELTYDPVSGLYIAIDAQQHFYSYNVLTDTWTALPKTGAPTTIFRSYAASTDHFNALATPIAAYGVIMFTECEQNGPCQVYLYKHSPSVQQPVDTASPAAPKSLRVK
jgi:hypothetical protein